MRRERDIIVQEVFPERRAKTRARDVEVFEVDLRWASPRKPSAWPRMLPIAPRRFEGVGQRASDHEKRSCGEEKSGPLAEAAFHWVRTQAQERVEGSPPGIMFHFRAGGHRAWVESIEAGRARPPQQSVDLIIT